MKSPVLTSSVVLNKVETSDQFLSSTISSIPRCIPAYLFVVLHVNVVLVSVLVAAGQRDDGDSVDGLH